MFLFAKNLQEDYDFTLQGIRDGVITPERLDEAVARVLGLKAALRLHKPYPMPTVETAHRVVGCNEHSQWAQECADKAITLIKEETGVLPLSTAKSKRILTVLSH